MSVVRKACGELPDGTPVEAFTVTNANGIEAVWLSYGATLAALRLPDGNGGKVNVVLGFDDLAGFIAASSYFGSTIGRFGNRIAGGAFELDGKTYALAKNEKGINHLHGGERGFDDILWQAEPIEREGIAGVAFCYTSPDGEEGYPGTLKVQLNATLDDDNQLQLAYCAETDATTPVNLTNHAYWNLAGAGNGTILDHRLTLCASHFLPVDDNLIPIGEVREVNGTPMDFRSPHMVGERLEQLGGYDHCYVLGEQTHEPRPAAELEEPASGRRMSVLTTEPAIQFYTGNNLDDVHGADGKVYPQYGALCLETQHYPDSPNQPEFPSTILRPGDVYRHVTIHRFTW